MDVENFKTLFSTPSLSPEIPTNITGISIISNIDMYLHNNYKPPNGSLPGIRNSEL